MSMQAEALKMSPDDEHRDYVRRTKITLSEVLQPELIDLLLKGGGRRQKKGCGRACKREIYHGKLREMERIALNDGPKVEILRTGTPGENDEVSKDVGRSEGIPVLVEQVEKISLKRRSFSDLPSVRIHLPAIRGPFPLKIIRHSGNLC